MPVGAKHRVSTGCSPVASKVPTRAYSVEPAATKLHRVSPPQGPTGDDAMDGRGTPCATTLADGHEIRVIRLGIRRRAATAVRIPTETAPGS